MPDPIGLRYSDRFLYFVLQAALLTVASRYRRSNKFEFLTAQRGLSSVGLMPQRSFRIAAFTALRQL